MSVPSSRYAFWVVRGAVDRDLHPLAGEDVAVVAACLHGARLQQDELREVATVQRLVFDLLARDQTSERRAARFDADGACAHRDRLGQGAKRERDVDAGVLADRELDVTSRCLKPLQRRRDFLCADGQFRERVAPLVIGHRLTGLVRAEVAGGDGDAGEHAAGAVADDAGKRGVEALGGQRSGG